MKTLIYDKEKSGRVFRKTQRMTVIEVVYNNEDGTQALAHTIVQSPPSVATIVRKEGKIALVVQFRSTTGKYYIELPAGCLNEGETEVQAASRETKEEAGLLIENAYSLVKGPSLLDPSKSDENYGVVVADFFGYAEQQLDEMEQISQEICWLSEEDVFERLKAQMTLGTPFCPELGIEMSGHSTYALLAYQLYGKV